jgi:cytochrome c biogenesis protein CcdA
VEALQVALALTPRGDGEAAAQREMVASLEKALEARRQRIMISQSSVNWVKCTGLLLQAACTLLAIAMVHSDNRLTAALAMALFATGVGISLMLIAAHARPFTGEMSVGPQSLLQVMPE